MSNLYYKPTKPLSYNKQLTIICGDRGHGKTYGFKDLYMKKSLRDECCRLCYVRRYQEIFTSTILIKTFLTDWLINNKEIEDSYSFDFGAKSITACNLKTGHKFDMVVFVGLSAWEKNKSIARPTIEAIMFDEFITRGIYLPNETITLQDIRESIFRTNNNPKKKVILLGNAISFNNPYFMRLGVKPKDFEKEFIVGKNFVIHYDAFDDEWQKYKRENSQSLFPDELYEDFSIGSSFLLDDLRGIENIKNYNLSPTSLSMRLQALFNYLDIQLFKVKKRDKYYLKEIKHKPIYSNIPEECANGMKFLDDEYVRWFIELYMNGKLLFDSSQTKGTVNDMFALYNRRFNDKIK